MPNQLRTSLACSGTVWPTPCARIAWKLGPNVAFEYPLGRYGSDVFERGVLGYPNTVVHCLTVSKKFWGNRVVSLQSHAPSEWWTLVYC